MRDAQLGGDELGHLRIHLRVERGHHAFGHQDPQNVGAGHAGRFGQLAHRAGQLDR